MKPILEIKNVSKVFRIMHEHQPYLSLRDSISGLFKTSKRSSETFYALQDVSFNVMPGESLGIIGRNGAGKSTLLKILSRITPPTSGSITVRGRIASLLEVGTGFHPELTGRENIFLNGSILGMKRAEIQSKFDQIIDFSGTEKFLDTQLKHYSSGMQLRLAFAVAAFLEPEILVIDEVLAVGDAEFQKKCIGKMEDVSKSGRTILFVSHNMAAVQSLCANCVYLEKGSVRSIGKSGEIINEYINSALGTQSVARQESRGKLSWLKSLQFLRNPDPSGRPALLEAVISSTDSRNVAMDLRLTTVNNSPAAFGSFGTFNPAQMIHLETGDNRICFEMETGDIANGLYYLSVDLTEPDKDYYDRAEHVILFEIINNPEGSGRALLQEWGYGTQRLNLKRVNA